MLLLCVLRYGSLVSPNRSDQEDQQIPQCQELRIVSLHLLQMPFLQKSRKNYMKRLILNPWKWDWKPLYFLCQLYEFLQLQIFAALVLLIGLSCQSPKQILVTTTVIAKLYLSTHISTSCPRSIKDTLASLFFWVRINRHFNWKCMFELKYHILFPFLLTAVSNISFILHYTWFVSI